MYFCNFIDGEIKGYNPKGVNNVIVSEALNNHVQPSKCYVIDRNGSKDIEFLPLGEKSEGVEIDFLGNLSHEMLKCSEVELLNTDENPVIVIATTEFKVCEGIPTYIKYFPVKGGVLVALLKGFILVKDKNGEMIPLTRNCDIVVPGNSFTYKADTVKGLNVLKDKESDLHYSDLVVSDCVISHTVSKDGSKLSSVKFNRDNFVVLNKGMFEEEKVKRLAKLKALEEEKKRKKKEMDRINREIKMRTLEEERKKEEAKKRATRKPNTQKAVGSEGAQDFLNILSKL